MHNFLIDLFDQQEGLLEKLYIYLGQYFLPEMESSFPFPNAMEYPNMMFTILQHRKNIIVV